MVWAFVLGLAVALMAAVVMTYRTRPKCPWCRGRHPERHPLMTTEEYLRLSCGGWKARLRELESKGKR